MFENWYKCLPMYDDISRQHKIENEVVYDQVQWQTYCNFLLPFQIIRGKSPSTTWEFGLYATDGVLKLDLMTILEVTQIKCNTVSGSDIIQYIATQGFAEIDCGTYYYYFSDGINEWWSEIFVIREDCKTARIGMNIIDGITIVIDTPSVPIFPPLGDPIVVERS